MRAPRAMLAGRFLSTAGTALLGLAAFLSVLGPCLCPWQSSTDRHGCCPQKPGFDVEITEHGCCVTRASQPASVAEAAGKFQPTFVAVRVPLAAVDANVTPRDLGTPVLVPICTASPPSLNLRI